MNKSRIESKMHELECLIKYKFKNLDFLSKAMRVDKPYSKNKDNPDELSNECLSTVGDAILKCVLSIEFYKNYKRKGSLTKEKSPYEENSTFHRLVREEHWINYSFNDDFFYTDEQPKENRMPNPKHDPFVEAIIAAIYYDSGEDFNYINKWILEFLYPLLKKYK